MVLAQTGGALARYRKLDDINVVTSSGEKIGEVDEGVDQRVEPSGRRCDRPERLHRGVIIGLDKLRIENNQFATALTKEQIQALPKWDD